MTLKKDAEKEYLANLPCPETDDFNTSGVLLSNEIEYYANNYKMIDPFKEENLKAASYELTVGHNFSLGGRRYVLSEEPEKDEIHIPPFEVVIIQTAEKINLPRFIIARWNVRVRYAYEGLLWVGGPQVDPGWAGNLSCPLYNLSAKYVVLKLGDSIAIMDFVKTTPYYSGKPGTVECPVYTKPCKSYNRPPSRVVFEDYDTTLKSALYEEAKVRIEQIDKDIHGQLDKIRDNVSKYGDRLDQFMSISFAAIAILVAALSIFVTSGQPDIVENKIVIPAWTYLFVAFSMGALFFSSWSFFKFKSLKSQVNNLARHSSNSSDPHSLQRVTFSKAYLLSILSFALLIILLAPLLLNDAILIKIKNNIFFPYSLLLPTILLLITIILGIFFDEQNDETVSNLYRKILLSQKICLTICLISIVALIFVMI